MNDDRRDSEGGVFGGASSSRRDHPPTNGTNGAHPRGMRTRAVPLDEHGGSAEPVDLVAVQADDELINALAAGMAVTAPGVGGYDADDRVAAILAAWKAEVDAAPVPELVDLDTAVAAVEAGRPPSRRARHLAPVAAAAAFVVLAIGGVSVGSYSAQPDDVLWGVSKVLYSERAESVEAAARVEQRIDRAKQALVQGQPIVAAQELQQAETDLAVVRPEEGRTELAEVQDFLEAKAQETPPGVPVDPGAPLASQPFRPVPAGATVEPLPPQTVPSTVTTPPSEAVVPGGPLSSTGSSDPRVLAPAPTAGPGASPAPTAVPTPGSVTTDPTTGGAGPTTTSQPAPDATTTPGQSMGQTSGADGTSGATAAGSGPATVGATS